MHKVKLTCQQATHSGYPGFYNLLTTNPHLVWTSCTPPKGEHAAFQWILNSNKTFNSMSISKGEKIVAWLHVTFYPAVLYISCKMVISQINIRNKIIHDIQWVAKNRSSCSAIETKWNVLILLLSSMTNASD